MTVASLRSSHLLTNAEYTYAGTNVMIKASADHRTAGMKIAACWGCANISKARQMSTNKIPDQDSKLSALAVRQATSACYRKTTVVKLCV